MKFIGFVLYGIYALTMLWILINGLIQLHLYWYARKKNKKPGKSVQYQLPFISIQVPVYNEKYVIEGLLKSLAQLDYPKHLYEIQVLDDSTDETPMIIDQQIILLRNEGIDAYVVRRDNRKGFKAGALQHGLPLCKGELIAIFDADFRPPTYFFREMIPYFSDEKVGLVQARWGHLNKEQNFLTQVQTLLLDMHFSVEQAGRHNAGYFINFCGTAGIWRKQCIIEAGGWDGDILSEDLDLSYRAQLKGWQVVFDQNVEVPAELPSVMQAFKIQQFRWTKGIAQVARKTLGIVWERSLPFDKKLHSTFHLLSSSLFLCLFINAVLTVPLLLLRNTYPEFVTLTNYTAYGGLNLLVLTFIYYKSSTYRRSDQPIKRSSKFFLHYAFFLVIYLAISVQNAIAVLQGLLGIRSAFIRTPKFSMNGHAASPYLDKNINWITLFEIALLGYFLYAIGLSFYLDDYFLLLFFIMMSWGLSILVYGSVVDTRLKSLFKAKTAIGY